MFLLRSLREFADLASCNLLVSCNSKNQSVMDLVGRTCAAYAPKSVDIDFFEPTEAVDSRQHGESINRVFARTTSKHVIVVDADVIVVSPEWLSFCKRHIDAGCFIVGTPYTRRWKLAQGDFPNIWCAMIDGDALRAAKLDMRPKCRFDDIAGRWTTVDNIDTAGCLWHYTVDSGLRYASLYLPEPSRHIPALLRRWSSGDRRRIKRARRAERRFARLGSLEFCFPGTNTVCCAHLLHAVGRPERVSRWSVCASVILDAAVDCNRSN